MYIYIYMNEICMYCISYICLSDIRGGQKDLTPLVRSWLMLVLPWHATCHGFGPSKSQVEITAQDRYPSHLLHLLPHPHTKITCLVKLGVALQGTK